MFVNMEIQQVHIPEEALEALCKKWQIVELAIFGSALGDNFRADSDLDVLVEFEEKAAISLFDHIKIKEELEDIIGREVDLVTRRSVEDSYNWIRRKSILDSARTVYEAG